MSANTKTRYGSQARYLPDQLVDIDLALERIMGWGKYSTTIVQGSWSGSVAASAGTHNGADGQDLTPNEEKAKEKYLRILGCMHYIRPAIAGVWSRHNHGGRDYSTGGSPGFMAQLAAYHRRENALANRGKDTGYHMLVFPKNIYKGYIGYVEATTNTYAWEQQTSKSKRISHVSKNQITYVVAETEVAGKRWYVTLTGKCIKAGNFKKIAKPAGATPEHPDVHPPVKPPTTPKPPVVPTPPPKPVQGDSVALNIGTRNVIYRRLTSTGKNPPFTNVKKGLDWSKRLPLLAKDVVKVNLHLLGTQEAGTYAASEELEEAIEDEYGRGHNWENILHGDNAGDICQGILWATDTLKLINEGKVNLTGTDHDWLVWTRSNVIGTEYNILFGVVHLEWHAGGTSKSGNKYDKLRQTQATEAMEWLAKNAGPNDIVILCGDTNSTKENAYDGPGKAAKATGFTDAEDIAAKCVDTKYDSYHGLASPVPQHGKQFDRFFVLQKQLDSGVLEVLVYQVDCHPVATKPGSDHFQTHISIKINTKK